MPELTIVSVTLSMADSEDIQSLVKDISTWNCADVFFGIGQTCRDLLYMHKMWKADERIDKPTIGRLLRTIDLGGTLPCIDGTQQKFRILQRQPKLDKWLDIRNDTLLEEVLKVYLRDIEPLYSNDTEESVILAELTSLFSKVEICTAVMMSQVYAIHLSYNHVSPGSSYTGIKILIEPYYTDLRTTEGKRRLRSCLDGL